MPDIKVKLGKRAAKKDVRTLRLANYIKTLPPPPDSTNNKQGRRDWGVMLNTDLGDCTIAAVGHAPMLWAVALNNPVPVFTDSVVKSYYENWDGYVDGDASTDQGGVELDVLNQWRQSDFDGHKLLAYVSANPKNESHIKLGVYLFGVVYGGVELPLTANDQLNAGQIWDVVDKNDGTDSYGSWGGHALDIVDYHKDGKNTIYECITWGAVQYMTAAFMQKYFSEAYPLLSQDWLANGKSPAASGEFDQSQLLTDLTAVTA